MPSLSKWSASGTAVSLLLLCNCFVESISQDSSRPLVHAGHASLPLPICLWPVGVHIVFPSSGPFLRLCFLLTLRVVASCVAGLLFLQLCMFSLVPVPWGRALLDLAESDPISHHGAWPPTLRPTSCPNLYPSPSSWRCPVPRAGPALVPPAPVWCGVMGPGCQDLLPLTQGTPNTPGAQPQGPTSPLSALTLSSAWPLFSSFILSSTLLFLSCSQCEAIVCVS